MQSTGYLKSELVNGTKDLNILDSVFDAILIINPEDEVVLEVSKSACKLYGFEYNEFVGLSLLTISKNKAYGRSKISDLLTKKIPLSFSTVQYTKSGDELYLDVRASLITYRGKTVILSVNRDITDQVKAYETIMEQREKYISAISSLDELVLLLDSKGCVNDYHQQTKNQEFYIPQDEFYGKHYSEILPNEISSQIAKIENIIRHEDTKQKFEFSMNINGFNRDYEATVSSFRNIKGVYSGFTVVGKNITEKKARDKQLRDSESLLRGLINSMQDGVCYCSAIRDEMGNIVDFKPVIANDYYCELNGIEMSSLVSTTLGTALPELKEEGLFDRYIEMMSFGDNFELLTKITRKGKTFWVIKKASKFSEGFIATLVNITERIYENLKFQNLFNNSFQGIVIYQKQTIKFANPAAENITGYTESELKNFSREELWNLIIPEDREKFRQTLQLLKNENFKNNSIIIKLKSKSGNMVWLEIFITAIEFDGEESLQIVFIDTTDKAIAEMSDNISREMLRAVLNSIPDLIYYKGVDHKIQKVNNSFLHFFGLKKEEIESKRASAIFGEAGESVAIEQDNLVFKNKMTIINDHKVPHPSGVNFIFEVTKSPIYDESGDVSGLVGIAHDVTERKIRENELNNAIAKLHLLNLEVNQKVKQLNELNTQLYDSKHKLQELNATKDKFFSIIAHDLRNPFNLLINLSGLLLENYDDYNDQDILSKIRDINESSRQSYSLLDNLLSWSRSQTGKISFNPTEHDFYEIIINTVYAIKKIADKKGVKIRTEVELNTIARVDYNMISTIIRNLISNAVKFTPPGGTVVISASNDENGTLVYVQDNGIGIDDETLLKLFRIDANITRPGTMGESGTGLGLIIAKEFIDKHKGQLWVESEAGKGSTFYFTLPQAELS